MSETPLDRLDQLAERAGAHEGALTTLERENASLRGRVEDLEGQLAKLRSVQQDLVARVERALAASGGPERLEALDHRLAASHASALRTAERVEEVAAEVAALGRLGGSLEQTRADVARQLAGSRSDAEQAMAELEARVRRDGEAQRRAVGEQAARVDRVAEALAAIEPLERGRREVGDALQRLGARLDAVVADREALVDASRAAQERADQRIAQLAQTVKGIQADAQAWQERTQEQMAILRDARTLTDEARRQVEQLDAARRASERDVQAFETRLEARVVAWRNDVDEAIEQFVARHDRERDQAERAHLAREVLRDEAAAEAREALSQRIESVNHDLSGRLSALVAEGLELRRQLAEWLTSERDAAQGLIATLERGGQSEAVPELAGERRAALRRAVQARRAGDPHRA